MKTPTKKPKAKKPRHPAVDRYLDVIASLVYSELANQRPGLFPTLEPSEKKPKKP